ncbi:MAG: hypothetical protein IT379_03555 [Deltaproteobacteria bacterium]|nr:hypothetical protein [Deltaproteobacteria bacterium]
MALATAASLGACADDGPAPVRLGVTLDEATSTLVVSVSRELASGETLHARVRRGAAGELDCAAMASSIGRIDAAPLAGTTYRGPAVSPEAFVEPYDDSWVHGEPTAEMLSRIADGQYLIDVCLVNGARTVAQAELDVRRALDRAGTDGKFDGEEGERIASVTAYGERCVAELGEIPFFPSIGEGDYQTYNCLDSVPIPTTVTRDDGTVESPSTDVPQCDEPQHIYSLCEPNAVTGRTNGPRVQSAANEQGTHWVLLCRKARAEEGAYNDIAMIGHNPYTGRTCFFQNALYSRTDGLHVPHPADRVQSERSPQQSEALWSGVHGGLGSGIQCASCHDSDPFIHTPWIDGALDANGDPVIPRMGVHEDFALGFNTAPYSIVNLTAQGWTMPRQLTSPEAAACTRCHRIGDGRWADDWLRRLEATDSSWTQLTTPAYRRFEHAFWMPPEVDGLDETSWPQSDFGRALDFIQQCADNPMAEGCRWEEIPSDPLAGGDDGLPVIDLTGPDLAREALVILGANVVTGDDPRCPGGNCATRRCAECHSVSRGGLRRWLELTRTAWQGCGLQRDPNEMSQEEARAAVDCMKTDPSDPRSEFAAAKLGILTTGAQYGYFRRLFQKAYGDVWANHFARFRARVGMPKGSHPQLSQREHAVVAAWFRADLAALDTVLPDPPAPTTCTEQYDRSALDPILDAMRFDGWSAVNAEAGIRMHGCPDANPLHCFDEAKYHDRSAEWGAGGQGTLRQLTTLAFRTSFWTRSSADGRYVGNGGGTAGATITDLLGNRDIGVDANYDPGFFPDNSGFVFQGATGGAGFCQQRLLDRDELVAFDEPECVTARGINLYQHVARGLGGGDYFVINSQFNSDPGNSTNDPGAYFDASSTMKLTPMVFDGTRYQTLAPVIVDSPFEGDSVLSPSGRMVISRLGGPNGQPLGYVLREVVASRAGASYTVDISRRLATICTAGAKPNISFDERFMVTHHYEGDGTSNVYLTDLRTGVRSQITRMPAGAQALFPHFRSDGWFYFLVRDGMAEHIVASDAAVRASAAAM